MAQDKKNYYNKSDLKARGWTDAMIRDFASNAELSTTPPGRWQRPRMHEYLYDIKQVVGIEKTKEFKDRKPKKKP